jgi:hypothetical protein
MRGVVLSKFVPRRDRVCSSPKGKEKEREGSVAGRRRWDTIGPLLVGVVRSGHVASGNDRDSGDGDGRHLGRE